MIAWIWSVILSLLVWLSADPQKLAAEPARCAAAVAAARATVVGQDNRRSSVESMEKIQIAGAAKCLTCSGELPNVVH
jgi:hypothetical protein